MEHAAEWLTFLNTIGFPLAAIYAHYKGLIITKREFKTLENAYNELRESHKRLEKTVHEDRKHLFHELERTRNELTETRQLLDKMMTASLMMPVINPTASPRRVVNRQTRHQNGPETVR